MLTDLIFSTGTPPELFLDKFQYFIQLAIYDAVFGCIDSQPEA
jgi:hypothetical protein